MLQMGVCVYYLMFPILKNLKFNKVEKYLKVLSLILHLNFFLRGEDIFVSELFSLWIFAFLGSPQQTKCGIFDGNI
jgi:hypothetical protein